MIEQEVDEGLGVGFFCRHSHGPSGVVVDRGENVAVTFGRGRVDRSNYVDAKDLGQVCRINGMQRFSSSSIRGRVMSLAKLTASDYVADGVLDSVSCVHSDYVVVGGFDSKVELVMDGADFLEVVSLMQDLKLGLTRG